MVSRPRSSLAPRSTRGLAAWLVLIAGCGGRADGMSACQKLCEIHTGCGYEVATCTERCDFTLQELPCGSQTSALLHCLADQPRDTVSCVETGPYSTFAPRDRNATACREQNDAAMSCSCEAAATTVKCF